MERLCRCGCKRSLSGRRIDCHYFEEACRSRARRREDAGVRDRLVNLRGRMSLRELAQLEREIANRERAAYERGRRTAMLDRDGDAASAMDKLERLADILTARLGADDALERVQSTREHLQRERAAA